MTFFEKNKAALTEDYVRDQISVIDDLRDSVQKHCDSRLSKFTSYPENEWFVDKAIDERDALELMKEELDQLAFVALYRIVELNTQNIIRYYDSNPPQDLYKIKRLRRYLKRKFSLRIDGVNHFGSIDEIRCINNDVKHNGKVSKDLANFPGWAKGQRLDKLGNAYRRLSPDVPKYLGKLVEELTSGQKSPLPSTSAAHTP